MSERRVVATRSRQSSREDPVATAPGTDTLVPLRLNGFAAGSTVAFELSATRRNYAERLAELDYQHAYVYAGYSAQAEIVNKGLQALKEFSKAIITTEEINKPAIALAVEAQAKSLKIDLISLAENEIEILRTIKEAHERRKSFDEQQIHEYKSEIDKAKRNV